MLGSYKSDFFSESPMHQAEPNSRYTRTSERTEIVNLAVAQNVVVRK